MWKLPYSFISLIALVSLEACISRTAEAKREFEKFLRTNEKMAGCGESSFLAHQAGDWPKSIYEFKNPRLQMRSLDLTEADQLNGLEFKGSGVLEAAASREVGQQAVDKKASLCWHEWEAGTVTKLDFAVIRSNGKWNVAPNFEWAGKALTIDCGELLKIPACK